MIIIKLISENYLIHYQSKVDPSRLVANRTSTVLLEDIADVKGFILGFGSILGHESFPIELINSILDSGFQVIYFTDKVPLNPIIHNNLIYISCTWEWFTHTCFRDYQIFSGVFYSGDNTKVLAEKFKQIAPFNCPIILEKQDIENIKSLFIKPSIENSKPSLLIDTVSFCGGRGLGDVLMTTIPLRYLAKDWDIDYYVRPQEAQVLENNPYIRQVILGNEMDIINQARPKIQEYSRHFILANYLEEYLYTERNRQCRIYSMCELLHINPQDIKNWTPVLKLTEEEKEYGKQFKSKDKPTIVIGFESSGSEKRTYPRNLQVKVIEELVKKYNVILTSIKHFDIEYDGLINLTGKLNLRQFLSVVYNSDMVLSTDTSIYWIGLSFNKPCVVIFSCIEPDWRVKPYPELVAPIYPPMKCKPCWERQIARDMESWEACKKSLQNKGVPLCIFIDPSEIIDNVNRFSITRGLYHE